MFTSCSARSPSPTVRSTRAVQLLDGCDARVGLLLGGPGRDRKAEDLADEALGAGQDGRIPQLDGGLTMGRHRVVDAGGDAAHLEEGGETIALDPPYPVEIIQVPAPPGPA